MADLQFASILCEKRGDGIAIITFNWPHRLNAMDPPGQHEIAVAQNDFALDEAMRVLILTGTGRAFSTGMDLKAAAERAAAGVEMSPAAPGDLPAIPHWKPVIAAINGYAIAGGLETALCCDLRIASERAQLGLFEAKRGLIPPVGVLSLTRTVPFGDALYLLLSADLIDAREAHRIGLVQRVVPHDQLRDAAIEIARSISANAPLAVRAIKRLAYMRREAPLHEAQLLADVLMDEIFASDDAKEGSLAFAEKREPVWKKR